MYTDKSVVLPITYLKMKF